MALPDSAINTLYDQLVSHAEQLGVFDAGVNPAEPWSTPGDGVWCALTAPSISPVAAASGLAATTVRLEFKAICGASALMRPVGRADKVVFGAAAALLNAYTGAFTLGGNVRNVDLLGAHGAPLSGAPAWMTIGEHQFRVYEITLPLIDSDVFAQVA
jgi:hypothetical protein